MALEDVVRFQAEKDGVETRFYFLAESDEKSYKIFLNRLREKGYTVNSFNPEYDFERSPSELSRVCDLLDEMYPIN